MTILTTNIADRLIEDLGDAGQEARAKKALRVWRADPDEFMEMAVVAALRALPKARRIELRQVARMRKAPTWVH